MIVAIVVVLFLYQQRATVRASINYRYEQAAHRVSDRLQFRQPMRADLDFYLEMAADPVAAESNGWSGQETDWVRRRFRDPALFEQLQLGEIVAVERSSGVRVGTVTFMKSPIEPDARMVGIHVRSAHRNQGYGRELMAGAIVLLQAMPGPVHVGTRITNVGMQQIMTKLGFTPEPSTHPYLAPDGQTYDSYWYQCGADTHPPVGVRPETSADVR